MSNTVIQIKRSQTSALPTSLTYGELAYSFQSGKLTIGQANGQVIVIGGNNYTQIIDAATSANTASTLVKRDSSGNFSASTISAELDGNSATTTKWKSSRLIGVSGDATGQVSVDGTANANVPLTLVTVNSNTGVYGGVTNIPVLTVNEKGLVTAAANVAISTGLNISGDTGSDTIDLLTETLEFTGGDGLTSNVTSNTVTFDVDATVLRTSGNQTKTGDLTIVGDFSVSGNTTFTGNTYFIDIEHYKVADPLIYLAANNYTSDLVPIGFAGNYYDGVTQLHTGLFRQPQSNSYFLFTGVSDELSANNEISPSANGFTIATLVANIDQGYVANLSSAISVTDGGTGLRSVASGDILYANGSNSLTTLSAAAAGNVLISGTSPSWDKVGLTTHVSGVLPIANGGTNASSIGNAGTVAYSNGTSYLFNTAGTSGQALLSGGTGAPTFDTLDLRGGGLGFTTANTNSVMFYSGSGNIISNTNTPSDGHVLQYSIDSGVQFAHLDGGSF
jgi:hypothetical protein